MNTLQQNDLRVERYLLPRLTRLKQLIRLLVADPRHPQGTRFSIDSMLLAPERLALPMRRYQTRSRCS